MKTTIYQAHSKTPFFKELREIFKDIRSSQFLAFQSAKRDISAKYRQSVLGLFWALSPVITTSIVWIFLNNAMDFPDTDLPRPLYIIIGTTLWTILIDAVNNPTNSINEGKALISKINFPKEALVMAGMYKFLFNASIKFLLVFILMIYFQIAPCWTILLFPLLLILLVLVGTAIGIMLAPIGLLFTDIGSTLQIVFSFLMYASPVVYAMPKTGTLAEVFKINPLTPIINTGRNLLTGGVIEEPMTLLYVFIFSFIFLLIGLYIFRISINILIEKIAS